MDTYVQQFRSTTAYLQRPFNSILRSAVAQFSKFSRNRLRLPGFQANSALLAAMVLAFALLVTSIEAQEVGSVRDPQVSDQSSATKDTAKPRAVTADANPEPSLSISDFRPRPMLRVEQTRLNAASQPVVDVHTHFGYRLRGSRQQLLDFVKVMDRNRIAVCVSLDGTLPDGFEQQQDFLWKQHRDRFVIFANIDWQGDGQQDDPASWACNQAGFVRHTVAQLTAAAEAGASGLKIFKRFGLSYRNADGSLVKIDDPRWSPIWEACGKLKLPILMHTADPAAFFLPIDETNERWEELSRHPDWSFYGDAFPTRDALLEARNRVIERHPATQFIAAHLANNAEDLKVVSGWLDRYPNLHVELASRIGELGRQPFTARRFLIKYQDRVLFGTDGPWPEQRLRLYWRFLETEDEYFPYSEKPVPPQGLWNIYGVNLPEAVLRKIYRENAAKLIPAVADRLKRWEATVAP